MNCCSCLCSMGAELARGETIPCRDEAVIRGREAAWPPVPSHGEKVLGQGEIWPL